VTAAAAVGGTASRLGGGSFSNGAVTAAFARLFNDESEISVQKKREEILSMLREVDEFRAAEASVKKRYGHLEYRFGRNIGGSNFYRGVVTIDLADMKIPLPVDISSLDMAKFVDVDADDYWDQVERFENMAFHPTLERIVIHEVGHGLVGSPSGLINDHPRVIRWENEFIRRHFPDQLPRRIYGN
jgi:hypothetical protein